MPLQLDVSTIGAIVIAAVLDMVIGSIWYARPVFGRRYMAAAGLSEEQARKGAGRAYAGAFVAALITAAVLAVFLDYANANTVLSGVAVGILVWVGFVATTGAASFLFQRSKVSLYAMYQGFALVAFIVKGAFLSAWLGSSLL